MDFMSTLEQSIRKHLRFNLAVNLLDGGFFGLGWGFGSIGTIIPLFVSHMTTSALLIGLIPSIHAVGWQLPQLFMANSVSRLRRYKPMVMLMTIQERLPFLGLALVALFLGTLGNKLALVLTFALLVWQGLGAGFTANAWQSMIAKIIPSDWRGTFFGAQAAIANVLMSIAAIAAGYILDRVHAPFNFTLCFLLTVAGLVLSYICMGLTREPVDQEKTIPERQASPWKGGLEILRRDRNFTAYLVIRLLSQFATMGFAFYIVYGLRRFGMSDLTAGFLTAALTISSTIANARDGLAGRPARSPRHVDRRFGGGGAQFADGLGRPLHRLAVSGLHPERTGQRGLLDDRHGHHGGVWQRGNPPDLHRAVEYAGGSLHDHRPADRRLDRRNGRLPDHFHGLGNWRAGYGCFTLLAGA